MPRIDNDSGNPTRVVDVRTSTHDDTVLHVNWEPFFFNAPEITEICEIRLGYKGKVYKIDAERFIQFFGEEV